ncbi:MAG: NAD-dependent epimerase/dehydratase family protein [Thermoleophilaceae bacterium]|nr:NAD-dependent epimerase/dehydratase family protein [Thermoleophilaceae bacterium]
MTGSRRILVTGLSTYWGGRLAQALERFDEVEAVIGVDNEEPQVELERTEYVKVGTQHALLRRVVEAAEVDTVVDTRLVVDSATTTPGKAHENNVIGTMNILAACSGAGSPVRKVVFKSSAHYYGCEQDDPAFFDETMPRSHPPRTNIERDVVDAEASLGEFAEKNPDVAVTVLRFANVLGPSVRTSHIGLLSLPAVPMILGFDPRYQFVHENDVVHALEHAVNREIRGVYNVAGDGVLSLSEVAGLLGKPYAPILPPWGTGLAASALRRLGIRIPPEAMHQLRFGRGVDNRRYKATGFHYQHTSRETVLKLGEHLRLSPVVRGAREPYRYEREVEEFLRWSPHVRNGRDATGHVVRRLDPAERDRRQAEVEAEARAARREASEAMERAARLEQVIEKLQARPAKPPTPAPPRTAAPPPPPREAPVEHYDDLAAEEVIALLGSLDAGDLVVLREHERDHARRAGVLAAIDSVLGRTGVPD